MKKEKIYEIGKKLGISKSDAKAALQKNRNKIIAGLIIGIAAIMLNRVWFEPLHYTVASKMDFDFFTRFF
jgi:hypothetical protein